MSTISSASWFPVSSPAAAVVVGDRQDPLQHNVELALAATSPERKGLERRRETRHPFPYPVHLTPVDPQGRPQLDDALTVLGKHLSQHGLDFYHREPLPWQRVIASLPSGDGRWVAFLMELTWCRFGQHGWYDNGGRFLSVAVSPLNATALSA
jgi:hypothetical protein